MSKKTTNTHEVSIEDVLEDVTPTTPLVQKLRNDIRSQLKRIGELELAAGANEDFLDSVREAISTITPLEPVRYIPKNRKVDHPMSAVVVFSDWHIGEVVRASEVEGFNAYNWDIAQKRAYYFGKVFTDAITVQQSTAVIDELVVVVIGDMISGDLHHELVAHNEFPSPEQAIRAGCLLSKTIAELAPHFKTIRVEFIVIDNHSRLTKKMQFKGGGENSYGNVVGFVARERLSSHKNVTFGLHKSIQELVEIQGFRYLCGHGATIKGFAGIPWYGIDRKVAKEAKARRRMVEDKTFDKLILGHYHTPIRTPDFMMNGSMSGTTEYDHGEGRHANPCQVAFLVHPKIGEVQWNEFYLQHADDMDFKGKEKASI
jgi:hypothetical protein